MTNISHLKHEIQDLTSRLQINQPEKIIIQLVDPDSNIVSEEWAVMTNANIKKR